MNINQNLNYFKSAMAFFFFSLQLKEDIINTFKDAQVLKVMNDGTRGEQYYNERFKQ